MRTKIGAALFVFIMISSFCLFGSPRGNCLAQQAEVNFGKDTRYDIYYQLRDIVQYVSNVKVLDTATIGGKIFLMIQSPNLATENTGYISVSNIIAILPAGSPKPQ
jgi:hypothetical protein